MTETNPYAGAKLSAEDLGEIERLTLALIRLTAWKSNPEDRDDGQTFTRSWKGYSFWALARLSDAGLIRYKSDYKTVLLTDEGVEKAEEALGSMGAAFNPLETRG